MIPPSIPQDSVYTSCYCEENVYMLSKSFSSDPEITKIWDPFVVFISNSSKTVALWSQKAAPKPDGPVVWDYHVVLILKSKIFQYESHGTDSGLQHDAWVYDFDTTLENPSNFQEYVMHTFSDGLPPSFQSLFRVISASDFLEFFASDRSHMLVTAHGPDISADGGISTNISRYYSPPPLYHPIQGSAAAANGVIHNLMSHYVDMNRRDLDDLGV
ncbi:N-terminal glutamine amidase-domain-containing protein, partial [Crepidotus variabilis]